MRLRRLVAASENLDHGQTDCDLSAHMTSIPESLTQQPEDKEAMIAFFKRNGFKSWLRELTEDAASPAGATAPATAPQGALFDADVPPVEKHYETVLTEADLDRWLQKINAAALTSIDTETTSLEPMQAQLVGISLCCAPALTTYTGGASLSGCAAAIVA